MDLTPLHPRVRQPGKVLTDARPWQLHRTRPPCSAPARREASVSLLDETTCDCPVLGAREVAGLQSGQVRFCARRGSSAVEQGTHKPLVGSSNLPLAT